MTETHHEFPRYRRLKDGAVFEAVRYGRPDGSWDDEAVTRITRFVLGVDVDTRMSVSNEAMLDVVKPNLKRWNLSAGIADIEVIDTKTGMAYTMHLGDWIVKMADGSFIYVDAMTFGKEYAVPMEFNELSDFIFEYFPWEGPAAKAVAETIAAKLIWAGWSNKQNKREQQ